MVLCKIIGDSTGVLREKVDWGMMVFEFEAPGRMLIIERPNGSTVIFEAAGRAAPEAVRKPIIRSNRKNLCVFINRVVARKEIVIEYNAPVAQMRFVTNPMHSACACLQVIPKQKHALLPPWLLAERMASLILGRVHPYVTAANDFQGRLLRLSASQMTQVFSTYV